MAYALDQRGHGDSDWVASGAYAFTGLGVGAYELNFHLAGYVDQIVVAAVNLSGPTRVNVYRFRRMKETCI